MLCLAQTEGPGGSELSRGLLDPGNASPLVVGAVQGIEQDLGSAGLSGPLAPAASEQEE